MADPISLTAIGILTAISGVSLVKSKFKTAKEKEEEKKLQLSHDELNCKISSANIELSRAQYSLSQKEEQIEFSATLLESKRKEIEDLKTDIENIKAGMEKEIRAKMAAEVKDHEAKIKGLKTGQSRIQKDTQKYTEAIEELSKSLNETYCFMASKIKEGDLVNQIILERKLNIAKTIINSMIRIPAGKGYIEGGEAHEQIMEHPDIFTKFVFNKILEVKSSKSHPNKEMIVRGENFDFWAKRISNSETFSPKEIAKIEDIDKKLQLVLEIMKKWKDQEKQITEAKKEEPINEE